MGQAKAKATARPELTDEMRAEMRGADPFPAAYDFFFDAAKTMLEKFGTVRPELIGVSFEDGQILSLNVVPIRRREDVQGLRELMLKRWPMVVDLFEGWRCPPGSNIAPSQHPERMECIYIMLHTDQRMGAAICEIDPKTREVKRGEMIFPDLATGYYGRDLPPSGMTH